MTALRGLIHAVRGPRPLAECGLSPSRRSDFKVEAIQSLPAMTSNTTPSGYSAAASSFYDSNFAFAASIAFNQDSNDTGWSSVSGAHEPSWLQRTFPAPITIGAYRITPWGGDRSRSPRDWSIECDTPSGVVVADRRYEQTDWASNRLYKLKRPVTTDRFRIAIERINGATIATIVELELFQVVK